MSLNINFRHCKYPLTVWLNKHELNWTKGLPRTCVQRCSVPVQMYGPLHTKAPSEEAHDTQGLPWKREVTVSVDNHRMTVDDPTKPDLLLS